MEIIHNLFNIKILLTIALLYYFIINVRILSCISYNIELDVFISGINRNVLVLKKLNYFYPLG